MKAMMIVKSQVMIPIQIQILVIKVCLVNTCSSVMFILYHDFLALIDFAIDSICNDIEDYSPFPSKLFASLFFLLTSPKPMVGKLV